MAGIFALHIRAPPGYACLWRLGSSNAAAVRRRRQANRTSGTSGTNHPHRSTHHCRLRRAQLTRTI
jgi:hypothetical protein